MMKTLILICAVGTSQADCSIDTAVDVIQAPAAGSPVHCGFLGQAYLADTALASGLDGEHYLKVVCTSRAIDDARSTPKDNGKRLAASSGPAVKN